MVSTTKILQGMIILGLAGFFISLYLTYTHYTQSSTVCLVGNPASCSLVNSSSYATLWSIPVAILGVIWFTTQIWLARQVMKKKATPKHLLIWNVLGILFLPYFIFAEVQLRTICSSCTIVHVLVLGSLLLGLIVYSIEKSPEEKPLQKI